jgi:hypothetical protein
MVCPASAQPSYDRIDGRFWSTTLYADIPHLFMTAAGIFLFWRCACNRLFNSSGILRV